MNNFDTIVGKDPISKNDKRFIDIMQDKIELLNITVNVFMKFKIY